MQSSFYTNFTSDLSAQEAQLNALQQQITTGLAVQTPDQNPLAFQTAALANDQVAALTNDNTTQAKIQTQLGSVNDIYQSVSHQRVRACRWKTSATAGAARAASI